MNESITRYCVALSLGIAARQSARKKGSEEVPVMFRQSPPPVQDSHVRLVISAVFSSRTSTSRVRSRPFFFYYFESLIIHVEAFERVSERSRNSSFLGCGANSWQYFSVLLRCLVHAGLCCWRKPIVFSRISSMLAVKRWHGEENVENLLCGKNGECDCWNWVSSAHDYPLIMAVNGREHNSAKRNKRSKYTSSSHMTRHSCRRDGVWITVLCALQDILQQILGGTKVQWNSRSY
jgi:hypothetical protein